MTMCVFQTVNISASDNMASLECIRVYDY